MKRRLIISLAVMALFITAMPTAAAAQPQNDLIEVIVVLDSDRVPEQLIRTVTQFTGGEVGWVYENALKGFTIQVKPGWVDFIETINGVAYVERNQTISIAAQETPTGLERIFAPDNPALRIDNIDQRVDVDVAVIDTGIDWQHPDLNVVDGITCTSSRFGNVSCRGNGDDGQGHGTHVAGTIGALDNNDGVVGVAPGARLHAVRVLDNQGTGSTATIIAGIDWVTARADTIEVANMSLGGPGPSAAMFQAIQNAVEAGVAFAVAAGNESEPASRHTPAAFNNVLTVSALADFNGAPGGGAQATCRSGADDAIADFSNFGPAVDIIAPGVCIRSTRNGGGTELLSGTSMASPHVAGALGLLASVDKPSNEAEVRALYADLLARGNFDWQPDRDRIQEPLLDVSTIVPNYGTTPPPPTVTPTPVTPTPPTVTPTPVTPTPPTITPTPPTITPTVTPTVTPEPSPGAYDTRVQQHRTWYRTTVRYRNPDGGTAVGTWSNGRRGGCRIKIDRTSCIFTSSWNRGSPPVWTSVDGTVVNP